MANVPKAEFISFFSAVLWTISESTLAKLSFMLGEEETAKIRSQDLHNIRIRLVLESEQANGFNPVQALKDTVCSDSLPEVLTSIFFITRIVNPTMAATKSNLRQLTLKRIPF